MQQLSFIIANGGEKEMIRESTNEIPHEGAYRMKPGWSVWQGDNFSSNLACRGSLEHKGNKKC